MVLSGHRDRVVFARSTAPTSQQWEIPVEEIPQGSYELVLGISSLNLYLDAIDSISFDIIYGVNQPSDRPSEVISSSSLRDLFDAPTTAASDNAVTATNDENSITTAVVSNDSTSSVIELSIAAADAADSITASDSERSTTDPDAKESPATGNIDEPASIVDGVTSRNHTTVDTNNLLRWKLHESIVVPAKSDDDSSNRTVKVIMIVETWKCVSSTPGAFELHVLELHQDSSKVYGEDPTFRMHLPFTWFIDIN
ncbi:hypothetical protein BGZ95_004985, partial [Linnemannia exigua]